MMLSIAYLLLHYVPYLRDSHLLEYLTVATRSLAAHAECNQAVNGWWYAQVGGNSVGRRVCGLLPGGLFQINWSFDAERIVAIHENLVPGVVLTWWKEHACLIRGAC
ncbi:MULTISPECIES: hypothetical protein [unclassified Frankia]